jgi:hypothetical protein
MIKIAMPNIRRELDWSKLRRDEMKKSSDHFTPPSLKMSRPGTKKKFYFQQRFCLSCLVPRRSHRGTLSGFSGHEINTMTSAYSCS